MTKVATVLNGYYIMIIGFLIFVLAQNSTISSVFSESMKLAQRDRDQQTKQEEYEERHIQYQKKKK